MADEENGDGDELEPGDELGDTIDASDGDDGGEGEEPEDNTALVGSALADPVGIAAVIIPINIEEEMRRSYLDYAMSVIIARALPDARDGLKPVQRRILM